MLNSRTDIKKEALINEYKGNLFEFLVGQFIAQHFKQEEQFHKDLLPEFKKRLESYEAELRSLDPKLIKFLMKAALETKNKIIEQIRITPKQVFVTGKTTHEGECDLFLVDEFNQNFSISLKLAKAKSYVNTKSGGAKSFIETYFPHNQAHAVQVKLNELMDSAFLNMGQKLYDEEGLGHFDQFKTWRENNLTELPGELIGKNKESMLSYYDEVIGALEAEIKKLAVADKAVFENNLPEILGFSPSIGMQVITEHENEQITKIRTITALDLKQSLSDFNFSRSSEAKSSFAINFPHLILQIRMKPMNKFTAGSMKVNCSVKYL